MWHNEIRSLAPRILSYERAVLANAAPPANRAADLVKNFLRLMHCSGSLILSSCADQAPKSLYGASIMPEPLVSTNGVVPDLPAIRNNAVIGESAPGWRFQTVL